MYTILAKHTVSHAEKGTVLQIDNLPGQHVHRGAPLH